MKKVWWGILIVGLLLVGCGTYVTETTSDGKEYKTYKMFNFPISYLMLLSMVAVIALINA